MAPATALVFRFRVAPTHNGPLLLTTGVAGIGFTTTFTVAGADRHPLVVDVSTKE